MKIRYICILLLLPFTFIYSHHTTMGAGSGNLTGRINLPGAGVIYQEPSPYIVFNSEYFKGARENKDILENSVFGEAFFLKGRLSLNLSFSHFYFLQKDKENVGRIGRAGVGNKLFILPIQSGWLFFWENRIHFPSGDSEKYIGGNYYTLEESIVFGKVISSFFPTVRIGGIFPDRSNYQFTKTTTEKSLPYVLKQFPETEKEELLLKKTTFIQLSIHYFLSESISAYLGYNYRTPYNGVEKNRDDFYYRLERGLKTSLIGGETISNDYLQSLVLSEMNYERNKLLDSHYYSEPIGEFRKEPVLFREIFIGLLWDFSHHTSFNFTFKYPLQREKYYRIYDTSASISLIVRF